MTVKKILKDYISRMRTKDEIINIGTWRSDIGIDIYILKKRNKRLEVLSFNKGLVIKGRG